MLSLLCRLPFGVFSGRHISHKFRQQTFYLCQHFQQTIFFYFRGNKLFFSIFQCPRKILKSLGVVKHSAPSRWMVVQRRNVCPPFTTLDQRKPTLSQSRVSAGRTPQTMPLTVTCPFFCVYLIL